MLCTVLLCYVLKQKLIDFFWSGSWRAVLAGWKWFPILTSNNNEFQILYSSVFSGSLGVKVLGGSYVKEKTLQTLWKLMHIVHTSMSVLRGCGGWAGELRLIIGCDLGPAQLIPALCRTEMMLHTEHQHQPHQWRSSHLQTFCNNAWHWQFTFSWIKRNMEYWNDSIVFI